MAPRRLCLRRFYDCGARRHRAIPLLWRLDKPSCRWSPDKRAGPDHGGSPALIFRRFVPATNGASNIVNIAPKGAMGFTPMMLRPAFVSAVSSTAGIANVNVMFKRRPGAADLALDGRVMAAQTAANLAKTQFDQTQVIDDITFLIAKMMVGHGGVFLTV